jgi:hypothetical protein
MEFLGSLIECYCRRSVDINIKCKKTGKNTFLNENSVS